MILERYVIRRLLVSFAMVGGVFLGMLLLLDMVEQLRRHAEREPGFGQILRLSILNLPEAFYEIAPLLLMLSAMWVGLAWSRSSELVVVRAAGRSLPRLMLVPGIVFLLFSMGFVAVMNPIAAASARASDRAQAELRGRPLAAAVVQEGLWLRQADALGQSVIHAARAEETGTRLHDATFLVYEAEKGLTTRLHAVRADLRPDGWLLEDVRRWKLDAENPEHSVERLAVLAVATDLTPEQIRDSFAQVRAIPLSQLPGFIAALERAGFAALEHRMRLHMELALPLLLVGMMLLAFGLSVHHARAGGAGLRALSTILAGFTLFFLRNFAQVLGETGQVMVLLAAWGLPVATMLLAIGILLNLEEG